MSTNQPNENPGAQGEPRVPASEARTESLPRETRPTEALPSPGLREIPLTPHLEPTYKVEADSDGETRQTRIGTVVWGLIVIALAALLLVSSMGWIALNGTYVLIGLMIGAGAALVVGGLLAARKGPRQVTKQHEQGSV
ncbi:hypothetical protein ACIPY2_00335 [Paenarthrobacter sp. NPDC089675]|uniref:hypothetical protein n=1 Tax=Paenarthrobacter sp. NPDC089675 TaxID=3364376 RepID=UPI00381CD310